MWHNAKYFSSTFFLEFHYNYYNSPKNSFVVTPLKFATNTSITGIGLMIGGPVGFGITTGYFILDQMGAFEGPNFRNGGRYVQPTLAPADALKVNVGFH